jgi:Domain of unknown function (DUF4265)
MVKITIPLSGDNLAGADTESVSAVPQENGTYQVKNVPFYAKGMSCEDIVEAEPQEGRLMFKEVLRHNGHSTYRIYAPSGRTTPEIEALLDKLRQMHCGIEPATNKLVAVDVLPEADIYKVYEALADAERKGQIDFQEGHCGHSLKV